MKEFYEEMLECEVGLSKDMVYEKCDFISLFSQLEVSGQEEYFRRFDESLEKLRLELKASTQIEEIADDYC